MYQKLMALAEKLNIAAGIGSAEPFDIPMELLSDVPFVNFSYEKRINPSLTMADAKSLVCIGLPYNTIYSNIKDNKLRGVFSSGAVGEDYHITIMNKLEIIKEELTVGYSAMCFSDTGPLIDREVAVRCSLGFIGKNFSIINDKIGGMFFIGYMITNIPYEKWNFNREIIKKSDCGDCEKCLKACPTGAINRDGFDYRKCISYITQKNGVLSDIEAKSIGRQIYGCDICQRVCIKNKFCFEENKNAYPDIEELLSFSNREFNSIYKKTAAGWRGKKILQRNAVIALGNLKDKRALPVLKRLCEDSRGEISESAKWAIENIEKRK